jgi:septal ring factor EnvC (AmiA/AmiB activator)
MMRETLRSSLVVLVLAALLPLSAGADDDAAKKKELQRIKQEMERKKREIRQSDRRERSVLSEMERLDRAVQAGNTDLSKQERLLRDSEIALNETQGEASGLQERVANLRQSYRARVRALYKMSRSGSTGALVLADDFSAAVKGVKYLAAIAGRDREVITAYGSTLADLSERRAEIERKRDDLVRRRRFVETKRTDLAAERRRKETLLASVRRERGLYEQTLQELEESSTGLWTMIRKADEERKQAAALEKKRAAELARAAAPRSMPPEKASPPAAAPGKGTLPWPATGQVVTPFGVQRHPQFGTVVFRRGIEIAAATGSAVRAVSAGQVAYADWYKGYGQLVIVEHGGGVYSLYGHLARIDAAAGSRVQRGQVIGLVGDTGSLKGPKLYFELRANGEAQDPQAWLAKR